MSNSQPSESLFEDRGGGTRARRQLHLQEEGDFQTQLDLHGDYRIPIGERTGITLVAELFNVLNQQDVLFYGEFTEFAFLVPDPDYGRPVVYAAPFRARFGARFEF